MITQIIILNSIIILTIYMTNMSIIRHRNNNLAIKILLFLSLYAVFTAYMALPLYGGIMVFTVDIFAAVTYIAIAIKDQYAINDANNLVYTYIKKEHRQHVQT